MPNELTDAECAAIMATAGATMGITGGTLTVSEGHYIRNFSFALIRAGASTRDAVPTRGGPRDPMAKWFDRANLGAELLRSVREQVSDGEMGAGLAADIDAYLDVAPKLAFGPNTCLTCGKEQVPGQYATPKDGQAQPVAQEWSEDDVRDDFCVLEEAAHPLKTGRHDLYARAMELVHNRRSKGALVDCVNALLYAADPHPAQADAAPKGADAERFPCGHLRVAESCVVCAAQPQDKDDR